MALGPPSNRWKTAFSGLPNHSFHLDGKALASMAKIVPRQWHYQSSKCQQLDGSLATSECNKSNGFVHNSFLSHRSIGHQCCILPMTPKPRRSAISNSNKHVRLLWVYMLLNVFPSTASHTQFSAAIVGSTSRIHHSSTR